LTFFYWFNSKTNFRYYMFSIEYKPSLSSILLKWNVSFKSGLILSLLSLRRYKEVWLIIKDSNGSRPSSVWTAKLVELFFTPSLQKPRWTFSLIYQMNLHLLRVEFCQHKDNSLVQYLSTGVQIKSKLLLWRTLHWQMWHDNFGSCLMKLQSLAWKFY
jgi:hypothetical protein